ncbi:MAG: foldase protein PrsA, partial [Terriglobia bacterium]
VLLVQKAKDLNISADTEVVERLDQIRKQMGLASIQDLENEVEKQGLVWEDFQNNIRRRLLTQQVIEQQVSSRIMVTSADARKYFDEHKQQFSSPAGVDLAEVQISTQKWGAAQAEARAKAAFAMLQAGAKWNDVVKKYSDGPNADSGGDVGFFPTGTLIPEISKAIKNLDPGETSNLISTQNGYMVVKLLQQRSAGSPKFEEVQEQVKNALYEQKMQPALRSYLTELRKESYIYLAPGFVDSGAVNPGAVGSAQELAQEDR